MRAHKPQQEGECARAMRAPRVTLMRPALMSARPPTRMAPSSTPAAAAATQAAPVGMPRLFGCALAAGALLLLLTWCMSPAPPTTATPGAAVRTASQSSPNSALSAANARCDVMSVVFWLRIVRTCTRCAAPRAPSCGHVGQQRRRLLQLAPESPAQCVAAGSRRCLRARPPRGWASRAGPPAPRRPRGRPPRTAAACCWQRRRRHQQQQRASAWQRS